MALAQRILSGDVRAAARLMRDIDDEIASAREELKRIYPHTGKAYIIGITGSPGTGKSTLVDHLIEQYRKGKKKIGVIAVDPTSPFSGGAILGDRIRMQRHSTDEDVFIRSLATRGALGGLSKSTNDIADVMDAMGKDIIIIETVGVGQDEVDIVKTAHTTLVLLVPGMGDEIQTIKAGILEVGDIFAINKADKEGADKTFRELQIMLDMNDYPEGIWRPKIFKTEAVHGKGISELVRGIEEHRRSVTDGNEFQSQRREKIRAKFLDILQNLTMKALIERIDRNHTMESLIDSLIQKKSDPYTLVESILEDELKPVKKIPDMRRLT